MSTASKNSNPAGITYRPLQEEDMPGILDLWKENSGWGEITKEQFEQWYLNTPLGPCITIVATDASGKVMGQLMGIPTILYLDGREVLGLKVQAPILSNALRESTLLSKDHPFLGLVRKGIEESRKRGCEYAYLFPAKAWLGLFKAFPKFGLPEVSSALLDCKLIPLAEGRNDPSLRVQRLEQFTSEFDQLWEEAKDQFPIHCAARRDPSWLQWKWGGDLRLAVYEDDKDRLLGYFVLHPERQLVKDIFARNQKDLKRVLLAVLHFLSKEVAPFSTKAFKGVKVMYTPLMKALLEDIPHESVDFQFAFSVLSFEGAANLSRVHPSRWYMMPFD